MRSPAVLPIRGYLLLFAAMTLVGTYVALSKPLTAVFPVFLLAWLRFALAAIAMLPWLRAGATDRPLDRRLAGTLFAQSLFGNFLFSILMLSGVARTSALATGLILATLPAVVAVLSWAVLGERLRARTWLAVALATVGVVVLTFGRNGGQPGIGAASSIAGHLMVFGCVVCEAIYVILGKRLTESLSARRISALLNLWGLALTTPLAAVQGLDFPFALVSAGHWALLGFYAMAASVFSTWLWLTGLRDVPASQSGVFTIAMPLSASAIAIGFLGERAGAAHALAFGCATLGILLIAWQPRTAQRRTSAG